MKFAVEESPVEQRTSNENVWLMGECREPQMRTGGGRATIRETRG